MLAKLKLYKNKQMKRFITIFIAILFCLTTISFAQVVDFKGVSMDRLIEITKAEDELRYDKTLEELMKHPNPFVRKRTALAAGRIGDEDAILMLEKLLSKDTDDIRQMAAFAIGELESIKSADSVLVVLKNFKDAETVRAKAIEAAGKIVAANAKEAKSKMLRKAILASLEFEASRRSSPSESVILHGITAVLRARPENADVTIAKFLGYSNWRVRSDSLNTLARLRAKNVKEKAKELLVKDKNAIVRANAARVLGGSGDKALVDLILNSALTDKDSRVRVNAIRALSRLKEAKVADKLLMRSEQLFAEYKKSTYTNPIEENELLTLASTLGNLLKSSGNARAIKFLEEFRNAEKHTAPEIEIALVRVSPKAFSMVVGTKETLQKDWRAVNSIMQGYREFASFDLKDFSKDLLEVEIPLEGVKTISDNATPAVKSLIDNVLSGKEEADKSFPSILNTYSKLEPNDLAKVLQDSLKLNDVIIRSTAANLLGDVKPGSAEDSRAIYRNLSNALFEARGDKLNDAALSILGALEKHYKNRSSQTVKFPYMTPFISAMESPDYLIRRRAAEIYKGFNIPKPDPMTVGDPSFKPFEIPKDIEIVKFEGTRKDGAKSRVERADYKRALSRKNGEWGAVLETDKGEIRINFFPEDAPLTVDNFIRLAHSGYFNGLAIHRVVPNFVMQDGDPRGDGSGGPGWQIRCEINQIQYERGMVGMALSGKDTGGSQWFITHSPQPHLDGGYTIFGKVNETDMNIVDNLARGDKIIKVSIIAAAPKAMMRKAED